MGCAPDTLEYRSGILPFKAVKAVAISDAESTRFLPFLDSGPRLYSVLVLVSSTIYASKHSLRFVYRCTKVLGSGLSYPGARRQDNVDVSYVFGRSLYVPECTRIRTVRRSPSQSEVVCVEAEALDRSR